MTPDPSSPSFDAANSQWLMETYHTTQTVNAMVRFNFTGTCRFHPIRVFIPTFSSVIPGPAIFIYGYSGPDYGSYEVDVDSSSSTFSAYASSNGSTPHLLYGANHLTYSDHQLTLRNLGARSGDGDGNMLLFDFLRFTVHHQGTVISAFYGNWLSLVLISPSSASASNITLEETDPSLTYSGSWNNNTSGNFSGGGSAYTQEDQASVSFPFNGQSFLLSGNHWKFLLVSESLYHTLGYRSS